MEWSWRRSNGRNEQGFGLHLQVVPVDPEEYTGLLSGRDQGGGHQSPDFWRNHSLEGLEHWRDHLLQGPELPECC